MLAGVALQEVFPLLTERRAASAYALIEVLVDPVRDQELSILGPPVGALGLANLLVAEGLAVRLGRIDLVGRAPPDMAIENDQRGALLLLAKNLKGPSDQIEVVRVAHPGHVPAVAGEAGGDIIRKGELGGAVDGDVVVVVDPAEVVELLVASQGRRLVGDPFLQVAIAADRVDVEVEDLEAGGVVAGGEPLRGDGHPDARCDPLSERAGGALHTRGPAV